MNALEQNGFVTETRRIIQHAIGNDLVIRIHPLDMAELICAMPGDSTVDIIATSRIEDKDGTKESHIVIGDKVYIQTTNVPRKGNTIA
jgi:hypothetical protein